MKKLEDIKNMMYPNLASYKNVNPVIKFRPSTMAEMKIHYPSSTKNISEQKDSSLQYKILKSDAKLVQSIFEANNFIMTEGHSWNIVWCNGNVKSYVYEGINPYQRVNHFPSSCEITRKDKL